MSAPTSAEIALTMAGSIPISALLQIAPAKTRSGAFAACLDECLNPRPIMVSCWSIVVLGQKAELGFSRVQTRGPRVGNVGMTGRTAIAKCGLPATKLVPVLGTSKQPQHDPALVARFLKFA